MRQGMGVRWLRLMRDMLRGMCPFLAPTKNSLNNNIQMQRLRKMNVGMLGPTTSKKYLKEFFRVYHGRQ